MPDIKFRLKRQDPHSKKDPEAHWEEYTVTYEGENLTVLEGLFHIQEKFDGSLSFRFCCRASVCGSCAMYINGAYRLACQTNVKHLDTDLITVAPMPHLPLVKDMVCGMDEFFAKYEYIMPWLIRNSPDPEKEIIQSPKERRKIDMPVDCILPVGVGRGELPGTCGSTQGLPVRGGQPGRGPQGTLTSLR
jgi:succinate dehydrogenase iron-sulfur subunit